MNKERLRGVCRTARDHQRRIGPEISVWVYAGSRRIAASKVIDTWQSDGRSVFEQGRPGCQVDISSRPIQCVGFKRIPADHAIRWPICGIVLQHDYVCHPERMRGVVLVNEVEIMVPVILHFVCARTQMVVTLLCDRCSYLPG